MRKHMKKIISTLLAGAMLLGSFSLSVVADENAETTAPVTTTTAPAVVDAFTKDAYYQESMGLLGVLGIFTGYEDGTYKPDSTITRAEMAAVILRTLGMKTTSSYTGLFTDVADSHWAASTIQTAADAGIISGMGDGTFAPDAPVTYEQAVKMIICALNYGSYAELNGGYPTGYIAVATQKEVNILRNASGSVGEEAKRGTVAKMIYSALNAEYPTIVGYENGETKYITNDDRTLASEKHKVYKVEGVVTATKLVSIDASVSPTDKQMVIDGDIYDKQITNADDLVASYVQAYYYSPDRTRNDMSVIYAFPMANKNTTVSVDAIDIVELENLNSSDNRALLKFYSNKTTKTHKMVKNPIIVYNGQLFDISDVDENDLNIYDEEGNVVGQKTVEEFLVPQVGTIKLCDFQNDGYYDVMFVEKYETIVVTSASEKSISGKFAMKLNISNDSGDKIISVTKDGEAIKPRNLKKLDIITVLQSINRTGDTVIAIDVCNTTVSGKIRAKDTEDGREYITVDGTKYEVDKNAVKDISVGAEATLHLDKFDRVAYIESAIAGKLQAGENYGVLVNVYKSSDKTDTLIRLFTSEGKVISAKAASKLSFAGWTKSGFEQLTVQASTDEGYEILNTANTLVNANAKCGAFPIRIVKYKINSKGEISLLEQATNDTSSDIGVVFNPTNYTGASSSGNTVASSYTISDKTLQFVVPNSVADYKNVSSYEVQNVTVENYINREGVKIDFGLGEFSDGINAGILVKFIDAGDSTAKSATYDTSSDIAWGVVKSISKGLDDDDNEVYEIKFEVNGNEVKYTTHKNATLSYANNISGSSNTREYGTEILWQGNTDNSLTKYLAKGDICGIVTAGTKVETIVRMMDISEYAKLDTDAKRLGISGTNSAITYLGAAASFNASSRDRVSLGRIVDINTDDGCKITVMFANGDTFVIGAETTTVVPIYSTDTSKTETESADSLEIGDYLIAREFRASLSQLFAIRFE